MTESAPICKTCGNRFDWIDECGVYVCWHIGTPFEFDSTRSRLIEALITEFENELVEDKNPNTA